MTDKEKWDILLEKAKEVLNPRKISPFIHCGEVSAAIMTKSGNIYTGICMDSNCTLGICAERNAIHTMITNGESQIEKIVCLMTSNKIGGAPCGACRELIMQLDKNSKYIEILMDDKTYEVKTMEELMPSWWGSSSFSQK